MGNHKGENLSTYIIERSNLLIKASKQYASRLFF